MTELDQELTKVFGIANDWCDYIRKAACNMAKSQYKNAILDDIVATIITEIYLNATKGKLCEALNKAKGASHNSAELLHNVSGVVWQAATFRASDERRKVDNQLRYLPFDDVDEEKLAISHPDIPLAEYEDMIVQELRRMAKNAHERLAKRYLLAAAIVVERIDNQYKAKDLMEKYAINSKTTWRKITLDIGEAIKAIAKRTHNTWLCETVQKRMENQNDDGVRSFSKRNL